MVEITNRQKKKKIRLKELKKTLDQTLGFLGVSSQAVSVVLCDNKFIRALNKKFFKRNTSTDVISFPLKDGLERDYLGEIIVSVEEASLSCREYGNNFKSELLLYSVHGILHLLGYRDETKKQREKMERKQSKILERLLQATGRKPQKSI